MNKFKKQFQIIAPKENKGVFQKDTTEGNEAKKEEKHEKPLWKKQWK